MERSLAPFDTEEEIVISFIDVNDPKVADFVVASFFLYHYESHNLFQPTVGKAFFL